MIQLSMTSLNGAWDGRFPGCVSHDQVRLSKGPGQKQSSLGWTQEGGSGGSARPVRLELGVGNAQLDEGRGHVADGLLQPDHGHAQLIGYSADVEQVDAGPLPPCLDLVLWEPTLQDVGDIPVVHGPHETH